MAETYLTELDYNGVTHVIKDKSALTSSSSLNPSNLSSAVPVAKGGTGATTPSAARTNLGLGSAATKDVDSALSSTSTNPVQNKAVQAPIAMLVDAGAKNILKLKPRTTTHNGVTFTVNDNGTITINGTATSAAGIFYWMII